MEYLKFTEIENDWNAYLAQIQGSTFNYTAERIRFDVEYAVDVIANESVIAIVDKKPVGAAVFYVEKVDGKNHISWSHAYCLAPIVDQKLSDKMQEKYLDRLLDYIEEKALQYDCQDIRLCMDPEANPDSTCRNLNYNFLLKKGYLDRSSLTQMLDLKKTDKELWSDVRKGHKSDIKKGNYHISFYDETNITQDIIEEYRRIYELDAGKVTRNSQMYQHYYEFVKSRKGLVVIADKNGENVGVLIATFFENTAYYNSYAELTSMLDGVSVGHQLQWMTILELQKRGIDFYEIGEQVYGPTHYDNPEEKLIQISKFKRGFGGYTLPFYRGIKRLKE